VPYYSTNLSLLSTPINIVVSDIALLTTTALSTRKKVRLHRNPFITEPQLDYLCSRHSEWFKHQVSSPPIDPFIEIGIMADHLGDVAPEWAQEGTEYITSPSQAVNQALGKTKKGGVLGKKRGKYNKMSRVTLWRHRVCSDHLQKRLTFQNKAKMAGNATLTESAAEGWEGSHPIESQDTTAQDSSVSPAFSYEFSSDEEEDDEEDEEEELPDEIPQESDTHPLDSLITQLKGLLCQVKSRRSCALSAYDCLRHLSVLRLFEGTRDGRGEKKVAQELAKLLWVGRESSKPENSLKHKTKLIKDWAQEYRETGKLGEHTQGAHKKPTSPLAREDVAKMAQKELARMDKPGPSALKRALLNKVFRNFGIECPKITENTCASYMKKWGWKTGGYRQWVPKNKSMLKVKETELDEGTAIEVSVTDTRTQTTSPSVKIPTWNAPIPSPSTAVPTFPNDTFPTLPQHSLHSFTDLQSQLPTLTSPQPFDPEGTVNVLDRDHNIAFWFSGLPQSLNQPLDPHTLYQPLQSAYATTFAPDHPCPSYLLHHQGSCTATSLSSPAPDQPEILGIHPGVNGEPVLVFALPVGYAVDPMLPDHSSFPDQFLQPTDSIGQAAQQPPQNQPFDFNGAFNFQYLSDMNQQ
jgi:hypothetical protein